ncbi:copper resistance protein CopC [Nocardioides sp. SOB44]|jgi:copper resistance protein C|uniref:Copper resistance protein CopC n=1 Tax=Nocardioides cremeus TaxID=3058044 RepID=A0ABT8TNW8_9ACTN|nr:copper resistance CopC family protein [Nocardioides cremeus]MDO3395648.1 copper resistance protein CopC [Nocardioides cremeus]
MNSPPQRPGWIVALGFLISACIVALTTVPAAAHTDLLSVNPADGDRLETSPNALTLTFTEDMSAGLSTITARVGNGKTMNLDVTSGASPTELVATVPEARSSNESSSSDSTRWRVSYRVVSRDGHPVTGSYTFTVRSPATPEVPTASESTTATGPAAQADTGVDADRSSSEPAGTSGGALALIGVVTLGLVVLTGIATARLSRRGSGT